MDAVGLGGSNLLRRDGRARRAAPTVPRSGPRRPSVVMFSGPIDSTKQAQGVITPSIDGFAVTGGLTRRPNRGTQRSVISLAVRDSSTPQDLVLSKSSRLGNIQREVNPATGSGNGIPPPSDRVCRQARRSFRSRRTTGNTRHHPATHPTRNRPAQRPGTHPY
jgi:hypothetical protein